LSNSGCHSKFLLADVAAIVRKENFIIFKIIILKNLLVCQI
jgi:hypothetical protein